jgi:uncharacterized protein
MSEILRCLDEQLQGRGGEVLSDVRIGLGYTAVQLESRGAGLAYTFRGDLSAECTVFRRLRPLAGRRASEVLPFLSSSDKLEVAVALATANALASLDPAQAIEKDVLDALELFPSDQVVMVGYFEPLVKPLKERVRELRVFDLVPRGEALPAGESAREWLARSDVALITSTTLINGTLEPLLDAAGDCRQVALVGASTPLVPSAFAGTPVTHLSGVRVTDPEEVLRVVSEGGGMPFFKKHVRKVVVAVGDR